MYDDFWQPVKMVLFMAIFLCAIGALFMFLEQNIREKGEESVIIQRQIRTEHNQHMSSVKANPGVEFKDGQQKTNIESEMNGFIELECGEGYSIMVDMETGVHYWITTTDVTGSGFFSYTKGHGQDLTPQYDSNGQVIVEVPTVLQALRNDYVYRQGNGTIDTSSSRWERKTEGRAG